MGREERDGGGEEAFKEYKFSWALTSKGVEDSGGRNPIREFRPAKGKGISIRWIRGEYILNPSGRNDTRRPCTKEERKEKPLINYDQWPLRFGAGPAYSTH